MMKSTSILTLTFVFLSLLALPLTSGHLAAGRDIEVGEYIIDFGYAPEYPVPHEETAVSLILRDRASQRPITPTHVDVDFGLPSGTVERARFEPDGRGIRFDRVFDTAGVYAMHVSFYEGDTLIAEATLDLPVKSPLDIDPATIALWAAVIIALVTIGIYYFTLSHED